MMYRFVLQKSVTLPVVRSCKHISCVSPDLFWISDSKNIILTNPQGEELYRLTDIYGGYHRGDFHNFSHGMHTVNCDGDLIYVDNKYNINKLCINNRVKTTLIRYTGIWQPQCVYSSSPAGDLLVGMYTLLGEFSRVVRYNSTGKNILTIQVENGKYLYSKPLYITENRNGDIIVSDVACIVVTDGLGRYRFSYTGKGEPRGICTDELSNILVCFKNFEVVHIIDSDGKLLSYLRKHTFSAPFLPNYCYKWELAIEQQGLFPLSLCYDDKTVLLWVGSGKNNTVNIYRVIYKDFITESEEAFEKEMQDGSCKIRQVRIMVVGHYGVGKTTLTYGLIGKEKIGIESTDGIDLFRARCRIEDSNEDTREWCLVQENVMSPAALAAAPNVLSANKTEPRRRTRISGKIPEINKMKIIPVDEEQKLTFNLCQDPSTKTHETVTSLSKSVNNADKTTQQYVTEDGDIPQHAKPDYLSKESEEKSKHFSDFYQKTKEAERSAELEVRMKDIFIDIWDFGGQNVFYTTHQSFLTSRCIYLLVINCAKDFNTALQDRALYPTQQTEAKVEDFVDFWVSTITNYAKSKDFGFPRIILIGTHVDEVGENASKRVEEVCLQIERKYPELVSKGQLVIKRDLFLNAKDTDTGKNASLREFIIQQAKCQPHWEEAFPKSWLHLLDFIVTKREEGIEILTLRELKDFNKNSIVPLTDISLENMLQRQHDIGDIIFFNTNTLKDIIILDPSFLIRALKSLISTRKHMERSGVTSETWRNLSTTGVASEDTIKDIWSRYPLLHKYADIFLGVFQHMDILVKPKSYVAGKQMNVNQEKIYFIPCMIEESDSIERVNKFLESSKELYEFYDISINHGILIPPAIGYRLLSFCTSMWPVVEGRLYTACGIFWLDLHHILILKIYPFNIRVYVVHRRSKRSISAALYNSVNKTLISFLEACLLQFHNNLAVINGCLKMEDNAFYQGIPNCKKNCPGIGHTCKGKTVEEVELSRLVRYLSPNDLYPLGMDLGIPSTVIEQIQNDHNSFIDQMFYVLFEWRKHLHSTFSDLEEALERCNINIHVLCEVCKTNVFDSDVMKNFPPDILDKVLSDQELDEIAGYIGRKYLQLCLQLGHSLSHVELVMDENKHNFLGGIRVLLRDWRKSGKLKPTVKMLGCAWLQCGMDFNVFYNLFAKQEKDLWQLPFIF